MNKYMKIYQSICKKIINGEYAHLQQLPSENELTKIYSTSRETVRKALNLLQEKGYIQKLRGKGSVVIYEGIIQFPISEMISFQEINNRLGLDYETVVEVFEAINAEDEPIVQHALELNNHDKLWHVIRTRQKNNKVHIMDEDYFVCKVIPKLSKEVASHSIYQYIENELNVEISYDICASKADTSKAQMIENEYRHNSKFHAYVDKYCTANGVTVEQALKHELVRQVFLMHTEV